MTITFQNPNIVLDRAGVVGKVHVGDSNVICHLNRGFSPAEASIRRAFSATGTVQAVLGPGDSLTGWSFGFIQIGRVRSIEFYYAGKSRSDGSIAVHAHNRLVRKTMLDSEDGYSPWTWPTAPRFRVTGSTITCPTGDHPMVRAGRELTNQVTLKKNFLFHIVDKREFWSVLVAMDPRSHIQQLAHLPWRIEYNVKFVWRGDQPTPVAPPSHAFRDAPFVAGAPADGEVSGLVAGPSTPHLNPQTKWAIGASVAHPTSNIRTDNPTWFLNVPADFYQ
jgi:hypothetical protein